MATRNQRERRAPERYGVISLGIPFDGVNSDLELEEEEIEQAGELGSSTNPVYSSSEDELEEPRRKRRRRGRERTETSSVRQHVNSSKNYHGRKDQGRPRINPLESRFTERHFPQHVPYNEKGRPKERECAVCKAAGRVKRCSFMCLDCNVGLCVAPCFRNYHTK